MADLHEAFKERVKDSRGERLAAGQDAELFSGASSAGSRVAGPCQECAQSPAVPASRWQEGWLQAAGTQWPTSRLSLASPSVAWLA